MAEPRTVRQTVTLDVTYDVVTEDELSRDFESWMDRAEEGRWLLIRRSSGNDVALRPYLLALDGPWQPVDQTD